MASREGPGPRRLVIAAPDGWARTDGVVTIRQPERGDAQRLIAGRDEAFHRFLGDGAASPDPTACITVDGDVVGWVDVDDERSWLEPGEVNLGYNVFPAHRGRGWATRAVQLLLHHLALASDATVATLLIDPRNERSLALARRAGFQRHGDLDGNPYWKKDVPPLTYTDGTVTIRRREGADLDADLEAKDGEQRRWLWLPEQRRSWEVMTPAQRRTHAAQVLVADHDSFGSGPKWTFTVDADGTRGVGYVDCDLANRHVTRGEANISYAIHPAHRGNGHAVGAVRLVLRFLADHTSARTADVIADEANTASLRVARAVGAEQIGRFHDDGRTMVRHRIPVPGRHRSGLLP